MLAISWQKIKGLIGIMALIQTLMKMRTGQRDLKNKIFRGGRGRLVGIQWGGGGGGGGGGY